MRTLKWILAVSGLCAALAGCGGGGGSSSTSATTNTAAPATTSTPVTGVVGSAFADPTAVPTSSTGVANAVPITVSAVSSVLNFPMATVTICQPGTNAATNCATISNVLVDTGSFGLRLFASAIPATTLGALTPQTQSGQQVAECVGFGSGSTWGTVRSVDLKMSGEIAQNLPIQVIADTGTLAAPIPTACSSGTNITTPAKMGANGILGIGTSPNDCGATCAASALTNQYYVCTGTVCTSVAEPVASQVTNPVKLFPVDNNGVIVEMAQIADTGATTGTGTLVFGIDTQSNNALSGTNATLMQTNVAGNMDGQFEGRTYTKQAFFDSGSSALFFESTTLSKGTNNYYTPAAPTGMQAVFTAANSTMTTVQFNVGNGTNLVGSGNYAFNNLGVAMFDNIDIGLPFFYGRHMYYHISGQPSTQAGTTPFVAYVSS
jgi:hypothetical protein